MRIINIVPSYLKGDWSVQVQDPSTGLSEPPSQMDSNGDQSGLEKMIKSKSITKLIGYLAETISDSFIFFLSDPTLAKVPPRLLQNCSAS